MVRMPREANLSQEKVVVLFFTVPASPFVVLACGGGGGGCSCGLRVGQEDHSSPEGRRTMQVSEV